MDQLRLSGVIKGTRPYVRQKKKKEKKDFTSMTGDFARLAGCRTVLPQIRDTNLSELINSVAHSLPQGM